MSDFTTGYSIQSVDLNDILVPRSYLLNQYPEMASILHESYIQVWGDNTYNQLGPFIADFYDNPVEFINYPTSPIYNGGWKAIASDGLSTLAITNSDQLYGIGKNDVDQLGLGSSAANVIPILTSHNVDAVGWRTVSTQNGLSCGIKNDNSLWVWGVGFTSQASLLSGPSWLMVISTGLNILAISLNGELWAIGSGEAFSDGIAKTELTKVSNNTFKFVAGCQNSYFAIDTTGLLYGWGNNDNGQLGLDDILPRTVPTIIDQTSNWVHVSTSKDHSLAIKNDGTLWGAGKNDRKQLGTGITVDSLTFVQEITRNRLWKKCSCFNKTSYALKTNGALWACGSNYRAALGAGVIDTSITSYSDFVVVGYSTDAITISNGPASITAYSRNDAIRNNYADIGFFIDKSHSFNFYNNQNIAQYFIPKSIFPQGKLLVAGSNISGQLGIQNYQNKNLLNEVLLKRKNWVKVSIGDRHMGGILSDGSAWVWGNNTYGQLGNGTTTGSNTPIPISIGNSDWIDIICGPKVTVLIRADGVMFAAGTDTSGAFGNGVMNTTALTPVSIFGGEAGWASASVSLSNIAAIKHDRTGWASGDNTYGQLGNIGYVSNWQYSTDTYPTQVTPVKLEVLGQLGVYWSQLVCGDRNIIGVVNGNEVVGCGDNSYSQLGISDYYGYVSGGRRPFFAEAALGGRTPSKLVAARNSFFSIDELGALNGWGRNDYGQLGTGDTLDVGRPTNVIIGGSDWKAVGLSATHAIALKADGSVYTWGAGYSGQLGLGNNLDQLIPQLIANNGDTWNSVYAGGDTLNSMSALITLS